MILKCTKCGSGDVEKIYENFDKLYHCNQCAHKFMVLAESES